MKKLKKQNFSWISKEEEDTGQSAAPEIRESDWRIRGVTTYHSRLSAVETTSGNSDRVEIKELYLMNIIVDNSES